MLSLGSKKILERKDSKARLDSSRNTNPSFVNLHTIEDKASVPSTSNLNVGLHERLYREHNEKEIKKNVLSERYYGKHHKHHHSQYGFESATPKSGSKSRITSTIHTETRSPNIKTNKYIHNKTASNRGLTYRLANLKSTEKKLNKQLASRRSPKQVSNKLYQDALERKKSRESHKAKIVTPQQEFKSSKSKHYIIASLLEDFNSVCMQNATAKSTEELDFLKTFDIMKRLGFVRQKDKISQAEINADKAMFMDFWQQLEKYKNTVIDKSMVLVFCLAIEGFSVNDVLNDKKLLHIYLKKPTGSKIVFENTTITSLDMPDKTENIELSVGDIQQKHSNKSSITEYLSKGEIMNIHQLFIQFARNRSAFHKLKSQNKYKVREEFDDNIRDKPEISKNSISIANRIRQQFSGGNLPY